MTTEPANDSCTSTVVLRPDGVVDDVQGAAPTIWLGRTLSEGGHVPPEVAAAATMLLAEHRGRHWLLHRRVWASIRGDRVAIDLVVCDAVPLRRSIVVVRDMIMRVLDLFRQQAPETGVELQLDYSQGVPLTFVADGEKITWVISTLVGTALRHLGKRSTDGRVSIVVDYELETSELVIRVSDDGPGISAERRQWLFENDPSTGKPTGLALTMVRDVILAHRGTLEVGARPGGGTSITFRIPRPED